MKSVLNIIYEKKIDKDIRVKKSGISSNDKELRGHPTEMLLWYD